MLHPHLLLPVEAGDLCRDEWLFRLPEQLVNNRSSRIEKLKSNFCIPGRVTIFFNIFIFAFLHYFSDSIPLRTKTIFPDSCSEKKQQ